VLTIAVALGISSSQGQVNLNVATPFGPSIGAPPDLTTATVSIVAVNADEVSVTLDTTGLSTDYISAFAFNLDPNLVPPDLPGGALSNFTSTGGAVVETGFTTSTSTQVDESGEYSLDMAFSGTTFAVGDTISFDLTDRYGLTPADFEYKATLNANPAYDADGQYYAAIDVHSTTNGNYSWVGSSSVPDACSTLTLLGLSLAGLGYARRRFLIG
jgi:hypothetical protein